MRTSERVGLVTGAGQGIGRAIALRLARDGVWIGVCDLNAETAWSVAGEIEASGGGAAAVVGDISRDAARIVAEVEERLGGLAILVNNAGAWHKSMVQDMSEADWRRVIDVNLNGVFAMSRAALPSLRKDGHGRIINIASTAAIRIGYASGACYTASKAAILGLTRHLAYETARDGITVNAICPGTTLTAVIAKESEAERRERLKSIPTGRFPTPEDHAELAAFLASGAASSITGQAIVVDAGASLGWTDFDTYLSVMGKGPVLQ